MKDKAWQLFKQTGNPAYYMLYKELSKNGSDDKSNHDKRD